MRKKILICTIFFLLFVNIAHADVGLGISPSKISLEIEEGKTKNIEVLIINTGDSALNVSVKSEGQIIDFTNIKPDKIVIEPEPIPHYLPIKNWKIINVEIHPKKKGIYTGTIIASDYKQGDLISGKTTVASIVELKVTPKRKLFGIDTDYLILTVAVMALMFAIILTMRLNKSRRKIA